LSNTYPSRYSPDKLVSAAQYITELICEKKAKVDSNDLPKQFWQLPKWAPFYRMQIVAANGLLKIYHPTAIIRALQSTKAYGIFSLRAPHLDAIIKEEQARFELAEKQRSQAVSTVKRNTLDSVPRPRQQKKSHLDRLREIDGEESSNKK